MGFDLLPSGKIRRDEECRVEFGRRFLLYLLFSGRERRFLVIGNCVFFLSRSGERKKELCEEREVWVKSMCKGGECC